MLWFRLSRGVGLGLAAGLLTLLMGALVAGPRIGMLGAGVAWAAACAAMLAAGGFGVGRLRDLRGARRARLLADHHPQLADRVRSAAELSHAPNGSPELVQAAVSAVVSDLNGIPLGRLVRPPPYWGRTTALAVAIASSSATGMLLRDDVGTGLYALTHPGSGGDEDASVGLWVSRLDVQVTYPHRLKRAPQRLLDPHALSVPEGTALELNVSPRIHVERAILKLGDRVLPFSRGEGKNLALKLAASHSAPLRFLARVDDAWIEDKTSRALSVEQDQSPSVSLRAPLEDQHAAADQPVPFAYRARDDHGLAAIDLVVQLSPDRERHTRLVGFPRDAEAREHVGQVDVVPAHFGVESGQTIAVWIEARDRDEFGGPNVGRSPVRTITVGDPDSADDLHVRLLERARDTGLDGLADRLETPVSESRAALRDRADLLAPRMRRLVGLLGRVEEAYAQRDAATAAVIQDMARRLTRLSHQESRAVHDFDLRKLRSLDRTLVRELEEQVLWLTDLLGRAKLDGASQLIERLNATRARMRKQLEELRRTGDPKRKQELLAEIVRARSELMELSRRLHDAKSEVPSDFVNYDALKTMASADPLADLERALQNGNLDAAEEALAALDAQVSGLQDGMTQGGEAYAAARFAPRSEAAERARSEINELARSQKQLAAETDRVARDAAQRSQSEQGLQSEAMRLSQEAAALERRARKLAGPQRQHALDSEAEQRASQRLRDTRDALRQGSMREALSMAERAADDLRTLAMERAMDARMFPGADGARIDQAQDASELARDAAGLRDQIAQNLPPDHPEPDGNETGQLQGQAPAQRALGETAQRLSRSMQGSEPGGVKEGLQDTVKSMQKAAEALEQGQMRQAQAHQRDALERLESMGEQLAQRARAGRGGGGEAEGEGGQLARSDKRVTIPQRDQNRKREDLRRRVLDARRARTPEGYSHALERYYQEILR